MSPIVHGTPKKKYKLPEGSALRSHHIVEFVSNVNRNVSNCNSIKVDCPRLAIGDARLPVADFLGVDLARRRNRKHRHRGVVQITLAESPFLVGGLWGFLFLLHRHDLHLEVADQGHQLHLVGMASSV